MSCKSIGTENNIGTTQLRHKIRVSLLVMYAKIYSYNF